MVDSERARRVQDLAHEWLRIDRDPDTREEIEKFISNNDVPALEARLLGRIAFGTAGLRAKMEAGFTRMNCVTVIQASQGLAAYLLEQAPEVKRRGVVIGHDARHNSKKFAKLAAAAFVAKNIKVWWYETAVHTPLVPFGVMELRASAGIMVTASHNPPQDNGYKVYWGNACQIIPPHDVGIATAIMNNLEPQSWDKSVLNQSLLVESSLGMVLEKYFTAVRVSADPHGYLSKHISSCPDFTYTAMHGVGLRYMTGGMEVLGLGDKMKVVNEQAHPDPDFPGLPFPNPEEKGTLDMAKWSADRKGTSLILATDPDADRLAVAERIQTTSGSDWYQFTGNQLGILLASHVLETYTHDRAKLAMIASTVSSRMLAFVAEKEGFHFAETLTGFKWIGNKALDLDDAGHDTRFGFEESIGYMIPGVVKDKDGVAASATFLAAVTRWKQEYKRSPYQQLQHLYRKYGFFAENNSYIVSPSPQDTKTNFDYIRGLGAPYPAQLGPRKVLKWRDLTNGYDSMTSDHKPALPVDATSQMLTCELEGNIRMTVRASGTEPKVKIYIESQSTSQADAEKKAEEVMADLKREWLSLNENGFTRPTG